MAETGGSSISDNMARTMARRKAASRMSGGGGGSLMRSAATSQRRERRGLPSQGAAPEQVGRTALEAISRLIQQALQGGQGVKPPPFGIPTKPTGGGRSLPPTPGVTY